MYKYASHYIPAKYNELRIEYTTFIDLGNPDHILPISGEYVLEVLVGDEILETTMTWDVTTMLVVFRSELNGPPRNDASYELKDPIENYFAPPSKKPPFIIPAAICVLIVISILAFLFIIFSKIEVNLKQMPVNFVGKVFTMIFVLMLCSLFGLLVLFWVKLTLIEMLPLLLLTSNILFLSFKFI